jgi:hypothetical protein
MKGREMKGKESLSEGLERAKGGVLYTQIKNQELCLHCDNKKSKY